MNMDDLVKYIIWVVFFGLAIAGIYFMLKKFSVI